MEYNIKIALPESESIDDIIDDIDEEFEEIELMKKGEKKIEPTRSNNARFGPVEPLTVIELGMGIITAAEMGGKAFSVLKNKIQSKKGKIKMEYKDIEDTVFDILENICGLNQQEANLVMKKSKEKYWLFQFKDKKGKKHLIKLYKDEPDFEYQELGKGKNSK